MKKVIRWAVDENEKNGCGLTTYFTSEDKARKFIEKALEKPDFGVQEIVLWKDERVFKAKVDPKKKFKL
jgi:hypothetical protein